MTALTNTAIEALQPGQELRDDRVPGLAIRANRSGKSWMLAYRTRTGDRRRPKLGAYPLVSLSQARDTARAWLAQVAQGGDPSGGFQAARNEPTIDDLWQRVERDHYRSTDNARSWANQAKQMYHQHIAPKIGGVRVSVLDYDTVAKLHASMRDTPFQANRVLAVLSKMMAMAERYKMRRTGDSPCRHIERFKEPKRRRYATPQEIATIGRLLAEELPRDPAGVAVLSLLMFTGARPSEILRASPDQVERSGDGGVLRIEDGKTGRRDVYLPPQAMAVLDRLPPGRKALAGRTSMPDRLWWRVREAAGCGDLWARDWRRTFASIGLANGMSSAMLGELLGHKSAQTTKIYARLMEAPAHQAAADTASRVEAMLGGSTKTR